MIVGLIFQQTAISHDNSLWWNNRHLLDVRGVGLVRDDRMGSKRPS